MASYTLVPDSVGQLYACTRSWWPALKLAPHGGQLFTSVVAVLPLSVETCCTSCSCLLWHHLVGRYKTSTKSSRWPILLQALRSQLCAAVACNKLLKHFLAMELTSGSQLLHQPVMSFWRPAKKPISGGQLWHQPLVASYELLAASNVINFWRAAMVPAAPGSLLKLLQHLLAASHDTNFWRPTMVPAPAVPLGGQQWN